MQFTDECMLLQYVPFLVESGDVAVNVISCDEGGSGVPGLQHFPALNTCTKQRWVWVSQHVDRELRRGMVSRSVGHYRIFVPNAPFHLHITRDDVDERHYVVLATLAGALIAHTNELIVGPDI